MRRSSRERKAASVYEPPEPDIKPRRKSARDSQDFVCGVCGATRWCRTGRAPPRRGPRMVAGEDGPLPVCRSCAIQQTLDHRRGEEEVEEQAVDQQLQNAEMAAQRIAQQIGFAEDAGLLYCSVVNKRGRCGCVDKFISQDVHHAARIVRLHREAEAYSKLKFENTDPSRTRARPGLGNGRKKSAAFSEFVRSQRRLLKEEWRLCERACQRTLCYSNNFLHKRLKTEQNSCRVLRTKGQSARGLLLPLPELAAQTCCQDRCARMAASHGGLVRRWRHQAGEGQAETRRVLTEMLTPSGGRCNCHQFITMVTGCAVATIEKVRASLVGRDDIYAEPGNEEDTGLEVSDEDQPADEVSESEYELVIEVKRPNPAPRILHRTENPAPRALHRTEDGMPVAPTASARVQDSTGPSSGVTDERSETSSPGHGGDYRHLVDAHTSGSTQLLTQDAMDISKGGDSGGSGYHVEHLSNIRGNGSTSCADPGISQIVPWNQEGSAFRVLRPVPRIESERISRPPQVSSWGSQSSRNLCESYNLACRMGENRPAGISKLRTRPTLLKLTSQFHQKYLNSFHAILIGQNLLINDP